jgi:alcohol dehydrogenase
MKALVYDGPGRRRWGDVAEPEIRDSEDVLVRVDAVTICGTDLHILHGDVPTVETGRVLGHEAVGTVEQLGSSVRSLDVGQRVLVSCISSCGRCRYCREGRYGQCLGGGGWILGHRVDGVQAERVRVPFADRSVHGLPDKISDEAAVLLADILPTAYEVGVLAGQVGPGDVVVVVGAGPIGLAALATCRLFSPRSVVVLDPAASRRGAALELGADLAFDSGGHVRSEIDALTDGLGADVVIEAVGLPAAFELCTSLVRPGGHVANVGVHGAPAILHLEELWIKDVTITTGLVDTSTTPLLLDLVARQQVSLPIVTHRFGLDEMQDAYDTFSQPEVSGALKVVLFSEQSLHHPQQA